MNDCRYCPMPTSTARAITCRSVECRRQQNTDRGREYQRAYAAKHGRSHSHRDYTPAPQRTCSGCGTVLVRAYTDEPRCGDCGPSPARVEAARQRAAVVARRARALRRQAKAAEGTRGTVAFIFTTCQRCSHTFITARAGTLHCSRRCSRKAGRITRRTREHNVTGSWTWSDFMRMAAAFNYCCAYCGTKPDRLDPEHVVALSRGGTNTISNLLPTCASCNGDKAALSLDVWAERRARRGLPMLVTTWSADDLRYWHLTSVHDAVISHAA
jgi:hypothetical protein